MVIAPVVTALGSIVLSELRGTEVASDRTMVTTVPSILAGSVRRACSCKSGRVCLGLTSPRSSQGSGLWRGRASLVRCAAKSDEGLVAGSRLSAWPDFLTSAGPRSFGFLLADVLWAARPAN